MEDILFCVIANLAFCYNLMRQKSFFDFSPQVQLTCAHNTHFGICITNSSSRVPFPAFILYEFVQFMSSLGWIFTLQD